MSLYGTEWRERGHGLGSKAAARRQPGGSSSCYDSDRTKQPPAHYSRGEDQQEYGSSSSCYDSDRTKQPPAHYIQ